MLIARIVDVFVGNKIYLSNWAIAKQRPTEFLKFFSDSHKRAIYSVQHGVDMSVRWSASSLASHFAIFSWARDTG